MVLGTRSGRVAKKLCRGLGLHNLAGESKNIVIDTGYLLGDGESDNDYTLGFNQGITKADRAIRAAGLQVKDTYPGLASKYSEDSDDGEDDLPAS